MVNPARRLAIPPPQPRAQGSHRKVPNSVKAIIFFRVPDVSHGRVAITEMCSRSGANAFCHRMARRNHQIETIQIEGFDGRWKQRQKITIVAIDAGNAI